MPLLAVPVRRSTMLTRAAGESKDPPRDRRRETHSLDLTKSIYAVVPYLFAAAPTDWSGRRGLEGEA